MNNTKKLYISEVLGPVAILFSSGTVLQLFLMRCGFSEGNVSLFSSVCQAVQTAVLFASLFLADRLRGIRGIISAARLAPLLLLGVLFLNSHVSLGMGTALPLLLAAGAVMNIVLGISNILVYKFPLMVLGSSEYGKYCSLSGSIANGITLALTVLFSLGSSLLDMGLVMDIACAISLVTAVLSAALNQSIRLGELREDGRSAESPSILSVLKSFRYDLLVPDVLRGLASGIFALVLVFASRYDVLNEAQSAWYVLLTKVAALCGSSLMIPLLHRKISEGHIILAACVLSGVGLPLLLLIRNAYVFLVIGFLVETMVILEGYAVPIIVSKRVPSAEMGAYTAKRLTALTGGSAVSSLLVSVFIDGERAWVPPVLAAVAQILFGLGYASALRKNKKQEESK